MVFGTHLTGAFGQSQDLYTIRNEAKRDRGSPEAVAKKICEDTQNIVRQQREADLDYILDPMFGVYYLFQPFAEQVDGVKVGSQENWFNNNVFYWRPQIQGPLNLQVGFTEKFIHLSELTRSGEALVILPSPYTLLMLSDVTGYLNKKEAITNLAEILHAEAQYLASKGIKRIQYDEPTIVVKQSLGSLAIEDLKLLQRGIEICGRVNGATTCLNTYFGNAGPIIPFLKSLPVDGLGLDGTETSIDDIMKYEYSEKELALGLLDARSTALEDRHEIVIQLRTVAEKTHPRKLWLTPNSGTEYRGYTNGIRKLKLLKEIKVLLNE